MSLLPKIKIEWPKTSLIDKSYWAKPYEISSWRWKLILFLTKLINKLGSKVAFSVYVYPSEKEQQELFDKCWKMQYEADRPFRLEAAKRRRAKWIKEE